MDLLSDDALRRLEHTVVLAEMACSVAGAIKSLLYEEQEVLKLWRTYLAEGVNTEPALDLNFQSPIGLIHGRFVLLREEKEFVGRYEFRWKSRDETNAVVLSESFASIDFNQYECFVGDKTIPLRLGFTYRVVGSLLASAIETLPERSSV